ncbi:hypothetical protein DUNSADRAFT_7332 [Dunaliella salina]|uniref:Uncharacterized protein n=1 Tax=Dunaliella salina TaxID=3046 RepID=A0ABQ7GLJ8_DUNSA|nr:hypothetical protein DUNSADRAFT_7332 [Dunaliella salina]|eukprot:KAF5835492.1 hypothetical protein DUNSADRAFT_7332 [Dunaliella salina]
MLPRRLVKCATVINARKSHEAISSRPLHLQNQCAPHFAVAAWTEPSDRTTMMSHSPPFQTWQKNGQVGDIFLLEVVFVSLQNKHTMRVVWPVVLEMLAETPKTQQPAIVELVVVEGALCTLQSMGANAVLKPLSSSKPVLEERAMAFKWEDLANALSKAFPGNEGRNLRELGRATVEAGYGFGGPRGADPSDAARWAQEALENGEYPLAQQVRAFLGNRDDQGLSKQRGTKQHKLLDNTAKDNIKGDFRIDVGEFLKKHNFQELQQARQQEQEHQEERQQKQLEQQEQLAQEVQKQLDQQQLEREQQTGQELIKQEVLEQLDQQQLEQEQQMEEEMEQELLQQEALEQSKHEQQAQRVEQESQRAEVQALRVEQQAQRAENAQLQGELVRMERWLNLQEGRQAWVADTSADAHLAARAAECVKITKPREVQQQLTKETAAAELGVAPHLLERPPGKRGEACFIARLGVQGARDKLEEIRRARPVERTVTPGGLYVSRECTALGQKRAQCMRHVKPIIRTILAAEEAWHGFDVFDGPNSQDLWVSAGPVKEGLGGRVHTWRYPMETHAIPMQRGGRASMALDPKHLEEVTMQGVRERLEWELGPPPQAAAAAAATAAAAAAAAPTAASPLAATAAAAAAANAPPSCRH